jgi:hypothetical protein
LGFASPGLLQLFTRKLNIFPEESKISKIHK